MAWIQSHTGLAVHHKTLRLKAALRWNLNETVGFLHRFWWLVMETAPSGDVTPLALPEVISEVLGLPVEVAAKALEAMEQIGWLDRVGERLVVHDWEDYSGLYLRDRESARERMRKLRKERSGNELQRVTPNVRRTFAERSEDNRKKERKKYPPTPPIQGGSVEAKAEDGGTSPPRRGYKHDPRIPTQCCQPDPSLNVPEFHAAWQEYHDMLAEAGKPVTTRQAKSLLVDLAKWGPSVAVASLRQSISAGWSIVKRCEASEASPPAFDAKPVYREFKRPETRDWPDGRHAEQQASGEWLVTWPNGKSELLEALP